MSDVRITLDIKASRQVGFILDVFLILGRLFSAFSAFSAVTTPSTFIAIVRLEF